MVPGAVPRHSWLGSAGGGGVWCAAVMCWSGCGWCVVWLVPRHSWRRFLCATPRHSWLGFAADGGGRSSPLLAEGPGRGSPPLLAGFRCRRWCVVCGVRRWCVGGVVGGVWCGWSLATPGGSSCVLLPATPGWVSLPVVVRGPRHSWLRVPGAVPRHSWLGSAGGGGVWCVVCGGVLLVGLWLVCGVAGPSPLLAQVPVCGSPPLLAGVRRRLWCAAPRHSWLGHAGCGGVFRGWGCPLLCVFVPGCPSPWSWCVCFCVLRFLSLPLGAVCRVLCCAVCPGLQCRAALLRVVSPGVVLLCAVLFCCARLVPLLVVPCPLVLPVALGPCALRRSVLRCAPALCVLFSCVAVCAVVRRSALCCVCSWVLCGAFPVLSALCGAMLRCAGALALCCSCAACCCWRPVLWCAAVCCAVSFGVLWSGAGSGGLWLSAGAVLWRPAVRFALLVVLVCVVSLCVRCCVALRVVLFGSGCVCAVVGDAAVVCPCVLWCLPGRSAVWWCRSGVSWCLAVLCVVLWCPAPCAVSAVLCSLAVLCWWAVQCGCPRCWCLFFLWSSFPLLITPAVFPCL